MHAEYVLFGNSLGTGGRSGEGVFQVARDGNRRRELLGFQ